MLVAGEGVVDPNPNQRSAPVVAGCWFRHFFRVRECLWSDNVMTKLIDIVMFVIDMNYIGRWHKFYEKCC